VCLCQVHEVYDNLRRSSDLVLDDMKQSVVPILMPHVCPRISVHCIAFALYVRFFSLTMFKYT